MSTNYQVCLRSCPNLAYLLLSLFSLAVKPSVAVIGQSKCCREVAFGGRRLGALDQPASSRPATAPVTTSDQAITAQKNKSHIIAAATQKNVEIMRARAGSQSKDCILRFISGTSFSREYFFRSLSESPAYQFCWCDCSAMVSDVLNVSRGESNVCCNITTDTQHVQLIDYDKQGNNISIRGGVSPRMQRGQKVSLGLCCFENRTFLHCHCPDTRYKPHPWSIWMPTESLHCWTILELSWRCDITTYLVLGRVWRQLQSWTDSSR